MNNSFNKTVQEGVLDSPRRTGSPIRLDDVARDAALSIMDDSDPDAIPDRRLALLFVCAHPAIDPGVRTPLMLQTVRMRAWPRWRDRRRRNLALPTQRGRRAPICWPRLGAGTRRCRRMSARSRSRPISRRDRISSGGARRYTSSHVRSTSRRRFGKPDVAAVGGGTQSITAPGSVERRSCAARWPSPAPLRALRP